MILRQHQSFVLPERNTLPPEGQAASLLETYFFFYKLTYSSSILNIYVKTKD